jgi:DMSO/TMAO reductase YedYZ molybdopterin-dependent catalytic subunit
MSRLGEGMAFRSTGLKRPKVPVELADRVPPGQYPTDRWPVLHVGAVPGFDPATWDVQVFGLVERPMRLTWAELQALPTVEITADMHCVTRWSKLGNRWEGVALRHLLDLAGVKPQARYLVFHCEGGYTANLPLEVAGGDDVLLALKHGGEPLAPEHGFPLRAVVPKRYAWKSAKWLRGIELLAEDRPGFWEQYGYSNSADPWQEERFAE